jgi:hypothetical protein
MLNEMSSREFTEWMVYYGAEPFGEELADARNAVNTAAVVNAVIAAAQGKQRFKPDAFRVMPQETEAAPDSPDQLYQKFRASSAFKPREPGNANGHDRKPEHSAHDAGRRD